jgi:uncharacterized membrane protein YsdA (DUF1294 family)
MNANEKTIIFVAFLGGWGLIPVGALVFRQKYSRKFWVLETLAALIWIAGIVYLHSLVPFT